MKYLRVQSSSKAVIDGEEIPFDGIFGCQVETHSLEPLKCHMELMEKPLKRSFMEVLLG